MEPPILHDTSSTSTARSASVISRHHAPEALGAARPLQRPCPVCRSRFGVVLGRLTYALFANSPLDGDFDVVACAECGYVSCDTPSTQQDFDRFYESYYYSPAYVAHDIPPEEDRYFVDVIKTVSRYLTTRQNAVFDVGCGIGGWLRKCRELGYDNLFAVDPSPACVGILKEAGFQAALGSVQDIPFSDIAPDVIVVSHIVEHLSDMRPALRNVRQRLDRGGVVYVEVPDAALYETYRPGIPLQYFYLQHVVHFDEAQLDNLFRANGFRKLESGRRVRDENCFVTPALWGIYVVDKERTPSFTPNFDLAIAIKAWFDGSTLDPDGSFAALAKSGKRVYVWGVGTHVQLMLGMSPLRDCNIICCVDQDPKLHGQTIGGIRVEPTSVLHQAGQDDAIVIGSLVHARPMAEYLRTEIGFRGETVTFSRDSRYQHR